MNSSVDSPSLVRWSDVVINIASSIALEALIQQRPIIYPFYLHRNKTIFDTPELVNLASGCEEVLSLLINHYKGKKLFLPNKDFLRQFLINEVYGGEESNDVLKTYYQEPETIVKIEQYNTINEINKCCESNISNNRFFSDNFLYSTTLVV